MLKDFEVPRRNVTGAGIQFSVRGACAEDVQVLIESHPDALDELVALVKGSEDRRAAVLGLMRCMPGVMAHLIAICADEPDQVEKVGKLPINIQAAALVALYELTLQDTDALVKLLGLLNLAMGDVAPPASP